MSTEAPEPQESQFVAPEGATPEPGTLEHPEGEPAITEQDAAERADEGEQEPAPIEGDDGDEGDEQGQDAPAEAPAEPGVNEAALLSEREIEKRFAKLDAESVRHRKRLGEILEEDALHIVPCPVCADQFGGWVFDPENVPFTEEQRERLLQLLNLADFGDIPQASWAQKCETCKGHGRVKTGSLVEGREVTTCDDCQGAGWKNLRDRPPTNGHVEATVTTTTGPTVYGTDDPDPRVVALREEGWYVSPPVKIGGVS